MPRPKPGLLIDTHIPEIPWDLEAACRGIVGLFFEEDDESIAAAKRICATCSIQAICLEQALAFKDEAGVWGGKTPAERAAILRRRRKASVA